MCGINAILDRTRHLDRSAIDAMNAATLHRGRDNTAVHIVDTPEGTWHLGHNRLSVIDTSPAANQPFLSGDGRYALVYNGETYNFAALRAELAAEGVTFWTDSDTEVVLQVLAHRGIAGLDDLHGMFALVFVDRLTGTAIVARDRSGMKPLYYAESGGRLVISSELAGITESGLVAKELDETAVNHYLRFRFARKPGTFFAGVDELLEGHSMEISGGSMSAPASFVRLRPVDDPSGGTTGDLLDALESLLVDAIRGHLIADVPVGLLLSGGIDSTLLLALIEHHGLARLETFSIVNDASEASFGTEDFHYSRLAASRYGDYPHVELGVHIGMLDGYEDFLGSMDQPIADQAALPTFLICAEARRSVKVALSGAGGDELFAGYNRHDAFERYLRHRPVLGPMAPMLRRVGERLPTGSDHRLRKPMLLAQKFFAAVGDDPADTYRRMQGLGGYHDLPADVRPWAASPSASRGIQFGAALEQDLNQYLISDILMMCDIQSMRSTLEMRIPFLDRPLLDWVAAIPPEFLISKGRKWMLGELLRRHDGAEFVDRKKEGFNIPLGSWLRHDSQRHLWEFIGRSDAMIWESVDRSLGQRLLDEHERGATDRTPELCSLLTLHCWLERQFG